MWRHLASGAALALGMSLGLAGAVPTDDGPILPGIDAPLPPEPPSRSAAPRSMPRVSGPPARHSVTEAAAPRREAPTARPDPFESTPAAPPAPQRRTGAADRSAAPQPPVPGPSAAKRYQQQLQGAPANRPQNRPGAGRDTRAPQRDPRAIVPGRAQAERDSTARTPSGAAAAPLRSQPSPTKAQGAPRPRTIGPQPNGPAERDPARAGQPAVMRRPTRPAAADSSGRN